MEVLPTYETRVFIVVALYFTSFPTRESDFQRDRRSLPLLIDARLNLMDFLRVASSI
jgi:hypothetical protein